MNTYTAGVRSKTGLLSGFEFRSFTSLIYNLL